MISEYKTDRWYRRDAFVQLHENLNTAIHCAVCRLYYINNSFSPAEDRAIYYLYTLKNLPLEYEKTICELYKQDINSKENYASREKLFRNVILSFNEKNA